MEVGPRLVVERAPLAAAAGGEEHEDEARDQAPTLHEGDRACNDGRMPELPEVEAWRRELDDAVRAYPIQKAGPAHVATLKTFDPPLTALAGEGFQGARRRAKRFLFPTDDDELVLMVHLMSAGRLRYIPTGGKGAKTPAFRLRFTDGGELQLTEAGPKKRAGVWLLRPDALEAELAHLGPEADTLDVESLSRVLASDSRRLHSMLRDQRLIAGIGRAWANEILHTARLSPYALSTQLTSEEIERLDAAIRDEMARGLELRLRGANDKKTYRVHNHLGEPCPRCGAPIAQVDFDEHTIFYCPECQTEGRVLKDRRLSRLLK
jgi:formamidopyrimidine-DNA glycosylase